MRSATSQQVRLSYRSATRSAPALVPQPECSRPAPRHRTARRPGCSDRQGDRDPRTARAGVSDPGIAQRLFISPKTVEHRAGRILAKLGARSRAEAAALAGAAHPGRPARHGGAE